MHSVTAQIYFAIKYQIRKTDPEAESRNSFSILRYCENKVGHMLEGVVARSSLLALRKRSRFESSSALTYHLIMTFMDTTEALNVQVNAPLRKGNSERPGERTFT